MKKLTSISVFILALTFASSLVMAQNMNMRQSMISDSTAPGAYRGMMHGQNMMGFGNRMSGNGMMGMMSMMRGGMNGSMMNMMRGRMQNMMNSPMRRMMMSVFVLPSLDTLGLSESQKSKLNEFKSGYVKKMQEMRSKMVAMRSDLSNELASNSPNLKKVHKLINQKSKTLANRQWAMIDTWNNMTGVLTPTQKKQFNAMNARDFMNTMMNNMSMSQMMATCQSMRSTGQGMMQGGMNGGKMGRGMMNSGNRSSMMK